MERCNELEVTDKAVKAVIGILEKKGYRGRRARDLCAPGDGQDGHVDGAGAVEDDTSERGGGHSTSR